MRPERGRERGGLERERGEREREREGRERERGREGGGKREGGRAA